MRLPIAVPSKGLLQEEIENILKEGNLFHRRPLRLGSEDT